MLERPTHLSTPRPERTVYLEHTYRHAPGHGEVFQGMVAVCARLPGLATFIPTVARFSNRTAYINELTLLCLSSLCCSPLLGWKSPAHIRPHQDLTAFSWAV
jgi:hypothetical protein